MPLETPSHSVSPLSVAIKKLVLPYWSSEEKTTARILLLIVLGLNLLYVYFAVLLNKWNGHFFDALQKLDHTKFNSLLFDFMFYVTCIILTFLAKAFLQNYLSFRWRSWMTRSYLTQWFNKKAFYKSLHPEPLIDNPDQRISEDINNFTFTSMQLTTSAISSIVNGIAFSIILWSLSPVLTLPLPFDSTQNLIFPGYMLWLAIIYSIFASYCTFKTGKPLVNLNFIQEKAEANFRFGLMRIVDRKEEVALLNGEKDDYLALNNKFNDIRKNYKQILIRQIYINSAQNIFFNALTVFPLLAAAPMFFAGTITLGVMIQLSGAFSSVSDALLLFVSNYQSLASWKAVANRLDQFLTHTDFSEVSPKQQKSSIITTFNENILDIKNVELFKNKTNNYHHNILLKTNFSLLMGQKILLQGASGIGKTTLVKTIAGIWPYATGEVIRPQLVEIVPQKPYFPIATLRDVLSYGNTEKIHSEELVLKMLDDFGLSHLAVSLDIHCDWNTKLSLGEQQRVNFIRISLIKPNWLILDEPTASLDTKNQKNAMDKLFFWLKDSAILTISHSTELEQLHDRIIILT